MRQTFAQLTYEKRTSLKDKHQSLKECVDTLVKVELCAVGYKMLHISMPLDDAWILLTGYNRPVLPGKLDQAILSRLRILLSTTSGESTWRELIAKYMEIPKKHRLIQIAEDGRFTFTMPPFDVNRFDYYADILNDPIPYAREQKQLLPAGKFSYNVYDEQFKLQKSGYIHESLRVKTYQPLSDYRPKKSITFSIAQDWLAVAKDMDEQLPVDEQNWQQKVKPITLRSLRDKETFTYEGLNHIAGGLASGKSTFRYVQTYWLVKEQQAKVGLVEGSVADVLTTVRTLKKLGINAVPIIGRSNRQQHLDQYMANKEYPSLMSIGEDNILPFLSTVCTLQAIAGDQDMANYYPCERLYTESEGTLYTCPIVDHCGIYKPWTTLGEAEVWVTTSQAVLKTKLPSMIDPYKRYLYEAMYDLLDVVFIDEADAVMQQFDDAFVETYSAFGEKKGLFEQLDEQFTRRTQGTYDLVNKPYIRHWQKNLSHLKNNIWSLLDLLQKQEHIRDKMKREIVYVQQIIYDIAKQITTDEKHTEKVVTILRNIRKKASYQSSPDRHPLHDVVGLDNRQKQTEVIRDWLQEVSTVFLDEKNEQQLFTQIIYFMHIAHIDAALMYIQGKYHHIEEFNQLTSLPILRNMIGFQPFMKQAMTGMMFGYRYVQADSRSIGNVEVLQYTAVGRDLLYHWHHLYEAADDKKGPATVFLSGTSYAPNSLHYHIAEEPTWLITSTRQQSELRQTCLPLHNPNDKEKIINVSGIRKRAERYDYLRLIARELDGRIKEELAYWKAKGENRRVLLVVNAYEDVKVVGEALKTSPWQGNYRLLARQGDVEATGEMYFPRASIEHFVKEEAQILVVPLLAVNRGYNILSKNDGDTEAGALFGSAFFLIRPYPVPQDLSYLIQILHGTLPTYLYDMEQAGKTWKEAIRSIRRKSRGKFEYMYQTPDFWALLSEEEREIVAWYTFIPVWQLIGRLLRGGRNARVFYCDGKFMDRANGKFSMLESWQTIMEKNDSPIFDSLYGPFLRSIEETVKERIR